jgi:hypothetical protein
MNGSSFLIMSKWVIFGIKAFERFRLKKEDEN